MTGQRSRILFVIPALNEEKNLPALLHDISALMTQEGRDYHIFVVDDGSTDATPQVLQEFAKTMPVTSLRHPTNLGVGQGFRTGFGEVMRRAGPDSDDLVVTLEADNTSDLSILPEMLRRIEHGADLVLASCYAPGGRIEGTVWWRVLLSWCANLLIRMLFNLQRIHTYSSFYRVWRVSTLHRLARRGFITERGFACMVELLIRVRQVTNRIVEVPMILKGDRRKGRSRMRVLPTMLGYLRLILKFKCSIY